MKKHKAREDKKTLLSDVLFLHCEQAPMWPRFCCCFHFLQCRHLSAKSSSFTLRLEQRKDVAFTNWALDVADDGAVGLVEELHAHLGTLALAAGSAEHL